MSNESPLVCICVPTYNAEKTVAESLQSILGQTYSNLIIKVSDNASTDRTLDIVRKFTDPRIVIYTGTSNIGAEGNFNRCIDLATGNYTAIYHADDIYEPSMVARQVAEFEARPEIGAVFSEAMLIDESSKTIGAITRPSSLRGDSHIYTFTEIFRSILRYGNFLMSPSAMLRTSIYRDEIKRFRSELFGSSADLDVWLRVLERHSIGILPHPLVRYRISTTQGSHTLGRMRITRGDFFRVVDHYLSREEIKKNCTPDDFRNKARLEHTDRIVRASNLFLLDRRDEAALLCKDAFSRDALSAAVESRRGLQTLLLAAYLRLCISLSFFSMGKAVLRRIKLFARR